MSHQVRLDDDVYERIRSQKRSDETFSEAIDRLTGDWTLLDFADGEPTVDAAKHRALLERATEQSRADTEERLERLDIDSDS